MIADMGRLTDDMIEKGADTNKDGNGFAWRENGEVHWEKGISADDLKEYAREAPLPYIAHFRIASCGGKLPGLCHPFPIAPDVSTETSGSINGFVLFHNGHWSSWRHELLTDLKNRQLRVPKGNWSDTRGIAWMAAYYGLEVLEIIDEKCAVLGPEAGDLEFYGSGWSRAGVDDSILVSNRLWDWQTASTGNNYRRTMCLLPTCAKPRYASTLYCFEHQVHTDSKSVEGTIETDPFRSSSKVASGGETVEQEAEESTEGIRETDAGSQASIPTGGQTALVRVREPHIAELRRWACGINVKRIDPDKQKRIQAAKQGNQIVGSL